MEITWWHEALALLIKREGTQQTITVTHDNTSTTVTLLHWNPTTGLLVCSINNVPYRWQLLCPLTCKCWRWYSFSHDTTITLHTKRPFKPHATTNRPSFTPHLKSPLGGRVLNIMVTAGTSVTKNTPLVVIESMKMENEIRAPHDVFIKTISIAINDVVEADQQLIVFDSKGPENGTKGTSNE